MSKDILRRVRFSPFHKGMGPTFALTTWDIGRQGFHVGAYGKDVLGYRLTMTEGKKRTVLFEGEDFGCSPIHAIDSDACIATIMSFLTLRPGDTDAEYFEKYTEVQKAYCADYAEALSYEVTNRYGEV